MKSLKLLVLHLFLASCGVNPAAQQHSQTEVVGGLIPSSSHPSTWSSVYVNGCSGILVAENIVITAAHCKDYLSPNLRIGFVTSGGVPFNESNSRPVIAKSLHYGYTGGILNDIAWLRFAGSIPAGYRPIPILSHAGTSKLQKNHPVSIAGYGSTIEGVFGGTRHYADSSFNVFYDYGSYSGLIFTGPTPGRGACHGDSGGPLYAVVNNKWVAIGVVGGPDEFITHSYRCADGAARFASLGYYQSWIESETGVRLATETISTNPNPNPNPTPNPNPNPNTGNVTSGMIQFSSWFAVVNNLTVSGFIFEKNGVKGARITLEKISANGSRTVVSQQNVTAGQSFKLTSDLNNVAQYRLTLYDGSGRVIDTETKLRSQIQVLGI